MAAPTTGTVSKKGKATVKGTVEELSPKQLATAKTETVPKPFTNFCSIIQSYIKEEEKAQDQWQKIMGAVPENIDVEHYTTSRLRRYFESFAQDEAVHEETLKLIMEVLCR